MINVNAKFSKSLQSSKFSDTYRKVRHEYGTLSVETTARDSSVMINVRI